MILRTQINLKLFYQLIPLIFVGMAMPVQITQNNFVKSLQYLKKKVRDKVGFFLQMSFTVLYKLILLFLMSLVRYT